MKLSLLVATVSASHPRESTFKVKQTDGTTIKKIREMAEAVLDGSEGFQADDGVDYGCVGRGDYDYRSHSLGSPVDTIDKAFLNWKRCVMCVMYQFDPKTPVPEYSYDKDTDDCANSSEESRAVCECDRSLIKFIENRRYNKNYKNYDTRYCQAGGGSSIKRECCRWGQYYWFSYNPNSQCCGTEGVKEIGTC